MKLSRAISNVQKYIIYKNDSSFMRTQMFVDILYAMDKSLEEYF